MTPSGAARLAGVTGDPVAHSLSPLLMKIWIEAAGLDALYAPFPIATEAFEPAVRGLALAGCSGLNVTLPHKEAALEFATQASPAARAVGAANLLTFQAGQSRADNTDIAGFLYALEPAKIDYSQAKALVLGAGGAARALVYALLTAGVADLALCNRSLTRAQALARDLAPQARIVPWEARNEALAGRTLVVNATSMGLKGAQDLELDWQRVAPGAVAFDSVYTPRDTAFLKDAEARGLIPIDGLDMLIGQARPSFEAFFGQPAPEIPDLRDRLIRALEAR